jgi:HEAT repeat protein
MGRGPEAASKERVEAAFGGEGEAVCAELVRLLRDKDKGVVERAARTLKKIAERDGAALFAWRKKLLQEAFRASDVRVQWNLTIVLGKLPLKGRDRALAIDLMFERLRDESGLNRTFALQALVDLSEEDAGLRARLTPIVREFLEHGTPAMKARGRKLMGMTQVQRIP